MAPWVHLYVDGRGNMGSCCVAEEDSIASCYGSLNRMSFTQLWQGGRIREFRLRLLNDEADPRCSVCYEQERVGLASLRKIFNGLYGRKYLAAVASTDRTGSAPEAGPVDWDIRFSNLCNFRCRTCAYYLSSGWFEDAKRLGLWEMQDDKKAVTGIKDTAGFLENLTTYMSQVEKLTFAGGEPLLMKENYQILKRLAALGRFDPVLLFVTNGSILRYRDDEIIPIWRKFKNLSVAVSLDGIGAKCEYLRKGLKWITALDNLKTISDQCPDARVYIHYTVSAFNVLHVTEFHRSMVESGRISAEKIHLIFLSTPPYYNMKILPLEIKKKAAEQIWEHILWLKEQPPFNREDDAAKYEQEFSQWEKCVDYMTSEDWNHLLPEFLDLTARLDEFRNEDCLSVFPELQPVFEARKNMDCWMPIISSGL